MTDPLGGTVVRATIDSVRGESPNPATDVCDLTLLPINDHRSLM